MKKFGYLIFAGLLGIGSLAHSATPRTGPYSASCRCDGRDAYDFGPQITAGKYAGRCLNNCVSRTIFMPEFTVASQMGSTPLVANVRHGKGFWQARIPVDSVKEIILQLVSFPAPLNIPAFHSQIRVRFLRAVHLESQVPGVADYDTDELIFSAEHNAPAGVPFDLAFEGLSGDYALAYRIRTLNEFIEAGIFQSAAGPRRNALAAIPGIADVEQYELNLTAPQKRAIIERFLSYGHDSGSFNIYHSLQKNCATELFFEVLDPGIAFNGRNMFNDLQVRNPIWNPAALTTRGILGVRLSNLNVERECLLRNPNNTEACLRP